MYIFSVDDFQIVGNSQVCNQGVYANRIFIWDFLPWRLPQINGTPVNVNAQRKKIVCKA